MKSNRIRNFGLNISVRGLIVFLLLIDIVTMTVLVMGSQETTRDVLVPTAAPSIPPSASPTIEPTAEPVIEEPHASMLNLKYKKDVYTVEDTASGFASEWAISGDGSAYAETNNTFETANIQVYTTGTSITSCALSRGGIPFLANHDYSAFLNVSSSVNRNIQVSAYNGDNGQLLGSKTIAAGPDMAYYEISFSSSATTYNGVLAVEFGNNGITEAHNITVQGIRIAGGDDNAAVRTNQLGYLTNEQKRCTFIYSCGDLFDVISRETGDIVYTGAIVGRQDNSDTGETDYYGDFSNFRTPGTYFIRSQTGVISHDFKIDSDPYAELRGASLRMLSYQRCGQELGVWAEGLAHPACHTGQSNYYLTDTILDTTGGWHDAGDYGRYVQTGAKTVNDLLLSYLTAPELFGDDNQGPDSGNGIPDILDEARYELEWMLKMQDQSGGGFFVKATTMSFPDDYLAPENDMEPLYLLGPDTVATADAAGTLALASVAFRETDSAFADKCLEAAKKGDTYLSGNPDVKMTMNPMGFSTGQYLDEGDRDGRFTTKMALYFATGETGYLEEAKSLYSDDSGIVNSVSWKDNGIYGAYLFLASSNGEKNDPEFYNTMLTALANIADALVNSSNTNSYHLANTLYAWGSNAEVANDGGILIMAYHFTGKQVYFQTALEQLNYLLGKNSLDFCFVSGFGINSPQHQHNRLSLSKGTVEIGFLSGGPDASREDNVTAALPQDTPPAKMYADDERSYSTNEIAIYYNSALLYLISGIS